MKRGRGWPFKKVYLYKIGFKIVGSGIGIVGSFASPVKCLQLQVSVANQDIKVLSR